MSNIKLGDAIASVTNAVGISPCEECKRRRDILNSVDFSKPITEVYKELVEALHKKP